MIIQEGAKMVGTKHPIRETKDGYHRKNIPVKTGDLLEESVIERSGFIWMDLEK
jgi:hypothetical protein